MEDQPAVPPVTAPRSRKGLWIGLAAGGILLLLLLCACVVAAVVVLNIRKGGFQLFPFNPAYIHYVNETDGISLYYPRDWVYREEQQEKYINVVLASSQDLLESQDFNLPGHAAMMITIIPVQDVQMPVNPASETFLSDYLEQLSRSSEAVGQPRQFKISGYPAISQLLRQSSSFDEPVNISVVMALRDETDLIILVFACNEADWDQYRPTSNRIQDSLEITAVP